MIHSRKTVLMLWLVGLSVCFSTCLGAAEPDKKASAAFEQLTSLVGNWEGIISKDRKYHVSYRLTAGGTVLVETWTLSGNRESLTLYSLDGANLIATHYCPQGNQPRLRLVDKGDAKRLTFEFQDGTNLQVEGKSHQHTFWIAFDGPDAYRRSETYVKNGSSAAEIAATPLEEPISYHRITSTERSATKDK